MAPIPSGYLSAALAALNGPVVTLATGHEIQLDGSVEFDLDFAAETVRIEGDFDRDSMTLSDARIAGLGRDLPLVVELPNGGEFRIEEPGDNPLVVVEDRAFVSLAHELLARASPSGRPRSTKRSCSPTWATERPR